MLFVNTLHLDFTVPNDQERRCPNVVWMDCATDCEGMLSVELQYSSIGWRYERLSSLP